MGTSSTRHLLVPHDFSETAQHALSYAIDLASKLGARITVMHAYEVPTFGYPQGVTLTSELIGDIHRAADTALAGVAAEARRSGVDVQPLLRQGPAWSEINSSATDTHADLIVMGTHGRHGVSRALIGSVAEKVVRTAPCPVLTVRSPA
jgi:nucleotide-binding universal stress UspA family protein